MSKCPFHQGDKPKLRSDLPPLNPRIAALPVDPERGYPVPFFVKWVDGKPLFHIADGEKRNTCIKSKLCWVCGQPLGNFKTFTVGPMCVINRTTAEPPAHKSCAEWSVVGCPFLSKPQMVRREDDENKEKLGVKNPAGIMIERNPGVTAVWTTTSYRLFPDGQGAVLIEIGEVESLSWWRLGRYATRAEVLESIESGLPILLDLCDGQKDVDFLKAKTTTAMKLLPP